MPDDERYKAWWWGKMYGMGVYKSQSIYDMRDWK